MRSPARDRRERVVEHLERLLDRLGAPPAQRERQRDERETDRHEHDREADPARRRAGHQHDDDRGADEREERDSRRRARSSARGRSRAAGRPATGSGAPTDRRRPPRVDEARTSGTVRAAFARPRHRCVTVPIGSRSPLVASARAPHESRSLDAAGATRAILRSGVLRPERPARLLRDGEVGPHWGPGLAALFAMGAARYGDRTALVDERGPLSFAELDAAHRRHRPGPDRDRRPRRRLGRGPVPQPPLLLRDHRRARQARRQRGLPQHRLRGPAARRRHATANARSSSCTTTSSAPLALAAGVEHRLRAWTDDDATPAATRPTATSGRSTTSPSATPTVPTLDRPPSPTAARSS